MHISGSEGRVHSHGDGETRVGRAWRAYHDMARDSPDGKYRTGNSPLGTSSGASACRNMEPQPTFATSPYAAPEERAVSATTLNIACSGTEGGIGSCERARLSMRTIPAPARA